MQVTQKHLAVLVERPANATAPQQRLQKGFRREGGERGSAGPQAEICAQPSHGRMTATAVNGQTQPTEQGAVSPAVAPRAPRANETGTARGVDGRSQPPLPSYTQHASEVAGAVGVAAARGTQSATPSFTGLECPACGRTNAWAASACEYVNCGSPLRIDNDLVPPPEARCEASFLKWFAPLGNRGPPPAGRWVPPARALKVIGALVVSKRPKVRPPRKHEAPWRMLGGRGLEGGLGRGAPRV